MASDSGRDDFIIAIRSAFLIPETISFKIGFKASEESSSEIFTSFGVGTVFLYI